MKSKLKFFAISALILFLIITCIGLLFPSSVVVSRAINIPTKIQNIKPFTHSMNNWGRWMQGTNNLTIKDSITAMLNSTNITITEKSDSSIVSIWKDSKGKKQECSINLYYNNNVTIVQWQFKENFSWYPWQRLSSMFNEKVLGPVMETSLDSLKKLAITSTN